MLEEVKSRLEKAKAAQDKKAAVGDDVDLSKYESHPTQAPQHKPTSAISDEDKAKILVTGVTLDDVSQRSGTYVQVDNMPMHQAVSQEGIEVMATSEALAKYAWLKDYYWKAVNVDADKYTAHVEMNNADGYFMRALPGVKTVFPYRRVCTSRAAIPYRTCITSSSPRKARNCTSSPAAPRRDTNPACTWASPSSISRRAPRVTFTMIHSWSQDTEARPRTGAIIEENGLFLSNYVIMRPVKSIQLYPSARCVGENATVRFNNVIVATPGSKIDAGSRAYLSAKGAKTEMVGAHHIHRRRHHLARLYRSL